MVKQEYFTSITNSLQKPKKKKRKKRTDYIAKCIRDSLFFFFFFQIPRRLETELQQRASERVERVIGTCDSGSVSERVRGWLSGEAERVSGLGPVSATVTLREWEKERVSESGSVRLRLREGFERVRGQTGEAERVSGWVGRRRRWWRWRWESERRRGWVRVGQRLREGFDWWGRVRLERALNSKNCY